MRTHLRWRNGTVRGGRGGECIFLKMGNLDLGAFPAPGAKEKKETKDEKNPYGERVKRFGSSTLGDGGTWANDKQGEKEYAFK